jgi:transposase-like protein
VKKDGHYRSYQLYYCHDCQRNFNDKTGTLFHYSRTPRSIWFLAIYLFFILWLGCSILETSEELLIPYERCYRFIRTVMERIRRHVTVPNDDQKPLKGKVESDEFYIKSGLKGRHYHEEIIEAGREPRRRALKPWRGRGTFEKDQPMIVCLHQRKGSLTYFNVPQRRRQPLISTLRKNIKAGSMVYTDDFRPYRFLLRYGYKHRFVNHSEREYARGDVHVNNCECASNLYQIWMSKFMGVNKHNLEAYSKTFQFIHQSRLNNLPREERFMQVLSCKQPAETFHGI